MPKINLLDSTIAELIAAGEVVERPASVIKEMVENSIDAGATHITVEIKRGGILYMRITDDGCGILCSDVPLAFLRHATSKISSHTDLDFIKTLGFRGEALAATAAVSKIEMFTHSSDEENGTHYCIEGGKEVLYEESGCPKGTTIIMRDLFYNTPARMKFLKKDVSEGNAVSAIVERLALSHPEIAFKLIREGKQVLSTSGDNRLESAIYSVLGRDFSKGLIPITSVDSQIKVSGFVSKPVFCRQSRAGQYVFLNNRYVHSGTVTAAVEQAYKNSSMVGKFPAFVVNLTLPFDFVDVNVHPAKTQIRFSDEKRIFDAVYYAVKNAILEKDTRPVIEFTSSKKAVLPNYTSDNKEYKQERISLREEISPVSFSATKKESDKTIFQKTNFNAKTPLNNRLNDFNSPFSVNSYLDDLKIKENETIKYEKPIINQEAILKEDATQEVKTKTTPEETPEVEIKLIGEAFSTYIVVERENSIFLIDKHAAHERIIFNELQEKKLVNVQTLLTPVQVRLSENEYDALLTNIDTVAKSGFEIEDFGNFTVIVRAIPSTLLKEDIVSVITEAASALTSKNTLEIDAIEHLYHTIACKAAIKAGYKTGALELLNLAKRVLNDKNVMYCPHGRPVAFEIKKSDLEKQFGRIQ